MLARFVLSAAVFLAITLPALAHPGNEGSADSFLAGWTHPFLGIDHILAMVAVGLWAAFLGGRAKWTLPAAFVVIMAAGFALALGGVALPMVEAGIAASVVTLGFLVAAAVRLPLVSSTFLVGLFAVLHGHAHGIEVSGGALMFGVGFAVSTILLHGAGLGLGQVLVGKRLMFARNLGGLAAGIGLAILGGWA